MSQLREATRSAWGPLSEPIHGQVPEGAPAWRDNAYLCFGDLGRDLFGAFHVSTSPNAEGRRARFSVYAEGDTIEIVEPLEPGSFTSASIDFDLDQRITVRSEKLTAELSVQPLFGLADYTDGAIIPSLLPEHPLHHYQQAASVIGQLSVDGRTFEFDGNGVRDRTWGYRDESVSIDEYIAVVAVFPHFAITSMCFRDAEGTERREGYRLAEEEASQRIARMSVTRDASGLFVGAQLDLADGGELSLRSSARRGGFWVPMGWERTGPTMSAYDEFHAARTADGDEGFGVVEQGALRRLF